MSWNRVILISVPIVLASGCSGTVQTRPCADFFLSNEELLQSKPAEYWKDSHTMAPRRMCETPLSEMRRPSERLYRMTAYPDEAPVIHTVLFRVVDPPFQRNPEITYSAKIRANWSNSATQFDLSASGKISALEWQPIEDCLQTLKFVEWEAFAQGDVGEPGGYTFYVEKDAGQSTRFIGKVCPHFRQKKDVAGDREADGAAELDRCARLMLRAVHNNTFQRSVETHFDHCSDGGRPVDSEWEHRYIWPWLGTTCAVLT